MLTVAASGWYCTFEKIDERIDYASSKNILIDGTIKHNFIM